MNLKEAADTGYYENLSFETLVAKGDGLLERVAAGLEKEDGKAEKIAAYGICCCMVLCLAANILRVF